MRCALVIGAGGGAVPMALRRVCTDHVDAVDMSHDVVAAARDMFGCNNLNNLDHTTTMNADAPQMADVELLVADGLDVLLGKIQVGTRALQNYDYIVVDVDAGVQQDHDDGTGAASCTAPHPAFLAPDVLGALAHARDQGQCKAIAINAVGSSRWIESTAAVLLEALGAKGATVVSAAGNVLFLWGTAGLPTSATGMQSAMDQCSAGVDFAGPLLREWVDAVAERERSQHQQQAQAAEYVCSSNATITNVNGGDSSACSSSDGSVHIHRPTLPDAVFGLAEFVNQIEK